MLAFFRAITSLAFFLAAISVADARAADAFDPSYWLQRFSGQDQVVLTPDEIRSYNRQTMGAVDQMADISSFAEELSREKVVEWIERDPLPEPAKGYFRNKRPVSAGFVGRLRKNIDKESVPSVVKVGYATVVEDADLRSLPTSAAILRRPSDSGFDTVQYSAVSPGEPLVVLHTSADGGWSFVQTSFARGWIETKKTARTNKGELARPEDDFLVMTGSRVNVFADKGISRALGSLPMGATLRLSTTQADPNLWAVRYPAKKGKDLVWITAYIPRSADVSLGYMPYTPQNAVKQALKMLGEEYGWGGRNGLRDCSSFLKDAFASFGLVLPRNSGAQALSGVNLAPKDAPPEAIKEALKGARPGITILGFDGHIMLYLGTDDEGRPHVAHQLFGYVEDGKLVRVNRAVITGLDLSNETRSGSFLERLTAITELTVGQVQEVLNEPGQNARQAPKSIGGVL